MHDLRIAARALRGSPVVTVVAILSLALGIGANTAIFSLVDSLLLRSLPVRDPERLAVVTATGRVIGSQQFWSYAIWREIHDRPALFDDTACWGRMQLNLRTAGEADYAEGLWASGSFFETLGVRPLIGNLFGPADDRRGGGPDGPVAVVSYAFWQRHFGGRADVVGQTLTLEGVPFRVIGVTPPQFLGVMVGTSFDVIVPLGDEPLVAGVESRLDRRDAVWLAILARLKPGQSTDAATAALRGIQPQIRDATIPPNYPKDAPEPFLAAPLTVVPGSTGMSSLRVRYERPLMTLMAIVALVLLIACANLANLLLARAAARRHELSVRVALGASAWRIGRMLLAESVVLSSAGLVLGVLFATWFSDLLVRDLSTTTNQVVLNLSPDVRVLIFTIAITVATVLLFGVAPALNGARAAPIEALKEHGLATAGGPRFTSSAALVVTQVALSMLLVFGAGLFIRTFASLAHVDLGFNEAGVLIVGIDSSRSGTPPAERVPTYERVYEAVRTVPGVVNAGVSMVTPVSGFNIGAPAEVSGGVALPFLQSVAMTNAVTPGWFATFGTPILAGRGLLDSDREGALRVAIVNRAFARKFLNGASPLGHTITVHILGPERTVYEIVGVAGDAVYRSLREPPPPTMYLPLAQFPRAASFAIGRVALSVRGRGSPADLTRGIAAAIAEVNPHLALTFRPLSDQVNASLAQERVVTLLSTMFGGFALLLAGLGLYGLMSYAVVRRRTEIGIRLALGAEPGQVVSLIFRHAALLVLIGTAVGATISLWAAHFVAPLLYRVQPRDPATLVTAAVVLAAVGSVAAWVPAVRASRVNPTEVLRES